MSLSKPPGLLPVQVEQLLKEVDDSAPGLLYLFDENKITEAVEKLYTGDTQLYAAIILAGIDGRHPLDKHIIFSAAYFYDPEKGKINTEEIERLYKTACRSGVVQCDKEDIHINRKIFAGFEYAVKKKFYDKMREAGFDPDYTKTFLANTDIDDLLKIAYHHRGDIAKGVLDEIKQILDIYGISKADVKLRDGKPVMDVMGIEIPIDIAHIPFKELGEHAINKLRENSIYIVKHSRHDTYYVRETRRFTFMYLDTGEEVSLKDIVGRLKYSYIYREDLSPYTVELEAFDNIAVTVMKDGRNVGFALFHPASMERAPDREFVESIQFMLREVPDKVIYRIMDLLREIGYDINPERVKKAIELSRKAGITLIPADFNLGDVDAIYNGIDELPVFNVEIEASPIILQYLEKKYPNKVRTSDWELSIATVDPSLLKDEALAKAIKDGRVTIRAYHIMGKRIFTVKLSATKYNALKKIQPKKIIIGPKFIVIQKNCEYYFFNIG